MPYQSSRGGLEPARRLGHVPIVESEFVAARLRSYRIFAHESVSDVAGELLVQADALPAVVQPVRWAMSFDGSPQEVATDAAFPSTRVGYVQVAGVLVHLEEMLAAGLERFVDPVVVKAATTQSLFSIVMPGSNVCRRDAESVRDSWRAELFDIFRDYKVEGHSLLDMYLLVMSHGGRAAGPDSVVLVTCPANQSCTAREIVVGRDGCSCPCCGLQLFPTDAMRIHEEVGELTSNLTALGRLMGVLEQLSMLSYVHYLFERQPRSLGAVAFVVDGPLALFGPPAAMKRSIAAYLRFVAGQLRAKGYSPLILVGVEKTGQFAEHAAELSKHLAPRTLMRLPDSYIFQRILASRASDGSAFGEDTYYGKKFFYKARGGQMLTISIPYLDEPDTPHIMPDDPARYSTLPSTLALLDEIGTKLYQDALIPVALAHSYASIPLATGSRVLKLLSRDLLGQANGQASGDPQASHT